MAINHLQKITARAKQLRKANPKLIWTDAIKKASKELAGKKVGAVKKKAAPKKAAKKKPHTKWGKVASHRRRVAGKLNKKYTKAQLEKIANDFAYATEGDLDKATYRLLAHPELVEGYLQKIKEWENKTGYKLNGTKKHTDTKSHNVNIRVVSGIDKVSQLRVYRDLLEREKKATGAIEYWRKQLKTPSSEANKKHAKSFVELTKKQLAAIREQIRIQKRLI